MHYAESSKEDEIWGGGARRETENSTCVWVESTGIFPVTRNPAEVGTRCQPNVSSTDTTFNMCEDPTRNKRKKKITKVYKQWVCENFYKSVCIHASQFLQSIFIKAILHSCFSFESFLQKGTETYCYTPGTVVRRNGTRREAWESERRLQLWAREAGNTWLRDCRRHSILASRDAARCELSSPDIAAAKKTQTDSEKLRVGNYCKLKGED